MMLTLSGIHAQLPLDEGGGDHAFTR